MGRGSSVFIATELRAGRSGDRIPVGGEIFRSCPNRPWCPPSLLYNGYRVFPGGKERPDVTLTPHPHIVPWSRKSRATPLLPHIDRTACTELTVPVQVCTLPLPFIRIHSVTCHGTFIPTARNDLHIPHKSRNFRPTKTSAVPLGGKSTESVRTNFIYSVAMLAQILQHGT